MQNFLPVEPYFQHIVCQPQWPLPLGIVASLKFLAIENMPPHFSAPVCYGQVAGWIRIPLGMEVCLGSGNIVLDGDPPPHGPLL